MSRSRKEIEPIVSAIGVLSTIIYDLVDLVKKVGGSVEDIYHLATPEGRDKLEGVARIIANKTAKMKSRFLRLVSSGHKLVLEATDGSGVFAGSSDIFGYIDQDVENWLADGPSQPTADTPVEVYEMVQDATFSQMFGSLADADVKKACLTPHQIKNFVRKYRNWLRTGGYATFFLFEANNQFFVASVRFDSAGGLGLRVRRFGRSRMWDAGYRHRVVVSQLA